MQKEIKKRKEIESGDEKISLPISEASFQQYGYRNNQMLSDIMFAASGMGFVVLLSHSIRLVSANSKQSLRHSASIQAQKANRQAKEIARGLGILQIGSLKNKTAKKQTM
ncbi:MAG: hypothetical protein JST58_04895 [Bacteroidetes bacterium]|nr:hypothetical protein [Bacteroidota bacterium]